VIHTKEQITEKLTGLETYVINQKGRIIRDIELQQVHQFIKELKADLIATKK
jgi:hypothetical protein|tara:strand:+ start:232 stop:387 length:156 start_codon:yes stop_codon:yes gene_type:complete